MLFIGVHVSKKSSICGNEFDNKKRKSAKSISGAIQRDINALKFKNRSINVVQIYTHGPRNTKKNKINEKKICEVAIKNNSKLVVHSTHITSKSLWTAENSNDYIFKHLDDQLKTCKKISSYSENKSFEVPLVIHLPDLPIKEVMKRMPFIVDIIEGIGNPVLFENVPVKNPKNAFAKASQINTLCDNLSKVLNEKLWGVCIDTAHLWSCGLNITEYKTQKKWFNGLTKKTSSQIKAFHLNGSKVKTFNKPMDMHYIAYSVDDDIYPSSRPFEELGIKSIIEFSKLNNVPIVCEINRGYEKDVKLSMQILLNS